MRVYRSPRMEMVGFPAPPLDYNHNPMRGGGVGSIFSTLYSGMIPIVKRAVQSDSARAACHEVSRSAKKHAMRAGLRVVSDALEGENVAESVKQNVDRSSEEFGREMREKLTRASKRKFGDEGGGGGGGGAGEVGAGGGTADDDAPHKKRKRTVEPTTTVTKAVRRAPPPSIEKTSVRGHRADGSRRARGGGRGGRGKRGGGGGECKLSLFD